MAAHYLPNLRKIITKKTKKAKPARTKLSEPLDFHAERSRVTTVSSGVVHASEPPNPLVPISNPLRPTLIRKRVAAAVPVPKNLQHWVYTVPWRRVIYVAVAVFVVVSICVTGMFVALNTGSKKPVCDEACMQYTTLLGESMDWSVAPCEDFHGFVCGKTKDNETSVRHLTNRHFVFAVLDIARHEEIPAEGQTAAQRAARLFKTCDDVVTQDTDYVPRLRGYMRDANLHWPQHPAERDANTVDVLSSMLELSEKWGWPCFLEFATEGVRDHLFEGHADTSPGWIEEVEHNVLTAAALDVAVSVLKQMPGHDTDRLPNVPLTGHQLFYVMHCYTYCGDQGSLSSCNEPLRHKEDFAIAFSCPKKTKMRSKYQCKSF